jgi:hypothetical protein
VTDEAGPLLEQATLEQASDAQVFAGIAALMRDLRRRGLVRSEKNLIGDYAEALVAEVLGGEVEASGANPGFDLVLPDGSRVQVKARRETALSTPSHYSDFSTLDDEPFDLFVGVLFDEDFRAVESRITSLARVIAFARPVHGKQRLSITALRSDPEASDLDLRSVQLADA